MTKLRFLRVGKSAWEFNFDTKRAQDKKNKHLEDDIETRNEQITQIWQSELLTYGNTRYRQIINLRRIFQKCVLQTK